ncbi:MAG: putative transport system permease protein [Solirubrobacteraceae bacterium]|jgi:putative ABC transport system permease protein|nr:putative transport system permease protein [Solirubrobacteraceae bacterium]
MLSLVLRGFMQRKLRVLLTGIAIALGVALMAGTYVLTDTINRSFAGIFSVANRGNDVVISPTQKLGSETRSQTSPITEQMLARVRETPGVAEAAGSIFTPATFLDVHGKRLTTGGAPAFVASESPKRFESFKAVHGRLPVNAGEVAIDEATAKRHNLKLGQQMIVAGSAPAKRYTIVGITRFGGGESFGGAGAAILTPPEAQRVVGLPRHFDQIDVAAGAGVTAGALRDRIRAILPAAVDVRTGAQQAAKDTSDLESNLSFIRTFLLVFAYVSLVVGAFIIFNTFSITVAQRTREFGLLRTLGASRRQILQSVIYEGLLLGVGGAVLGLLGGIALAPALNALFKAFGADLPHNGTVIETRTIVVSLLVGLIVTLLAGLAPAIRATRVPPLAAMREGVGIPPRPLPSRRVLVARFLLALVVFVAIGVVVGGTVVLPVLLVLWGLRLVRLIARVRRGNRPPHYRVVPALARAIGVLVSWRGITGRLARENSIRQPGRTMITAAALTVGLALVAFVAVLADGTKATIDQAVTRSFAGDLIVENSQAGNNEQGIPALVAPALRRVHGVASVTPVAFTVGRLRGSSSNASITAVEPSTFERVYRVEWKRGSNATLLALGSSGTILTKSYAESKHLKVGQTLSVLTPTDQRVALTVRGIASDNARLLGNLTINLALARSAFGQRDDALDFVSYGNGVSNAQVQPAVNRLLASAFPQARSRTAAQFKQDQAGQINTLLALIYVLLALSVIVSLFGIVNTLILSVYERTRELGMLRAIGTSRKQIRQMIRYESVITALIGGVFGLVIGVVGAILVTTLALSGSGFVQSIPVGTLAILLVVAALAGLIAAQLPARRAARLDMLQALASE